MTTSFQSPEIQAFATGFPVTLLHAGITVVILFAAAALYVMLTPHKEITLIRDGNTAAAVSLGGVLVGLAIPLAVSLKASTTLIELALWGVAVMLVQLLIFRLVDLVLHGLPRRIQDARWPPPPCWWGQARHGPHPRRRGCRPRFEVPRMHFPRLPDWLIYAAVVVALLIAAVSRQAHIDAPAAPPPARRPRARRWDRPRRSIRRWWSRWRTRPSRAPAPPSRSRTPASGSRAPRGRGLCPGGHRGRTGPGRGGQGDDRPECGDRHPHHDGGAPPLPLGSTRGCAAASRPSMWGSRKGGPARRARRLLGRENLVVEGRGARTEPVLVWAETGRTDGLKGTLGGLSGAPALDDQGRVIGVTIAEAPRRGRIYTTSPETTAGPCRQTRASSPNSRSGYLGGQLRPRR